MTFLRPGMKGHIKLPDGSVFPVAVAKDGVPDVDDSLKESPSIDDMEGRELDAAVAARVFGLKVEPRENRRTHQPDFVYEVQPGQWVQVAYYSSGAAWLTLSARLQDSGWRQTSAPRDTTVTLQHSDGRSVSSSGRTQGEALARAALQTVLAS